MDNALIPYKDIEGMADAVVKSRLFPSIQSREAAMTLMLLCQAENIHPMMALRRYDIIQGRPALKSDAMLAEFQKRGGKVKWLRLDDECAEAEFMSAGLAAPVKIKFDTADAKRAGLLGKDNWNKYPRAMRRARVISEGIRTADPGVNAGVYTPEEVADFDQPKVVQVEAEVIEAPASEHEPPVDEAPPPSERILTAEEQVAVDAVSTDCAGGELFGAGGDPQPGVIDGPLDPSHADPPASSPRPIEDVPTEEFLAAAARKREDAARRYIIKGPEAPVEDKLEAIKAEVAKKVGRPKSVPDFCDCSGPIQRYETADGSGFYWECHVRNRERHVLKDQGCGDDEIRSAIGKHFFKWGGKAATGRRPIDIEGQVPF